MAQRRTHGRSVPQGVILRAIMHHTQHSIWAWQALGARRRLRKLRPFATLERRSEAACDDFATVAARILVFPVAEFFLEEALLLTKFVEFGTKDGRRGGGDFASRSGSKHAHLQVQADSAVYDFRCAMCGRCDFDDAESFGMHVATCFGTDVDLLLAYQTP